MSRVVLMSSVEIRLILCNVDNGMWHLYLLECNVTLFSATQSNTI